MKAKEFIPPSKPRNFVAKNQKTAGAGAHRDKKKEQKQGYEKHRGKGMAEDAETLDRETHLVRKLGRLGERIVQNPKLWDKYSEAVDNDNNDWIISLIQEGTGADKSEVMKLAQLFSEIGGGLGRLIDFAWAVKEGTWEKDFLKPYLDHKKSKGMEEDSVMEYETHRYKDDQGNEWEVNDEGERTLIRAAPGGGYGGGSRYGSRYPRRPAYNKPKGYYFYNVPPGKENDARAAGLMQSKSGKWYSTMSNSWAEKAFGKGRYWEPKESVEEGWKEKLAAAGLAATIGLGAAGGASARVIPGADPSINRLTGEPVATQVMPSNKDQSANKEKVGFSTEYLKKVANGEHPRPMISKEDAKKELERRGESW